MQPALPDVRSRSTGRLARPAFLLALSGLAACAPRWSAEDPPERLSAYGLFEGDPRRLQPADGVEVYELSTPLFSDYADKTRMVRLPSGGRIAYEPEETFAFPVGTVIAKTFSYPADAAQADGEQRLIETRILLHGDDGWVGLPYVWNEEQTEATLELAGGRAAVDVVVEGAVQAVDYRVPNANQCKGCHRTNEREMKPIGPRAGLLNHPRPTPDGAVHQLADWVDRGVLTGTPTSLADVPHWPVWNDPESGSLDRRARAWLDINCAHCHNPRGPARTSGLDLRFVQEKPVLWGVGKSPVAAGRGSGDRLVDIAPGDPDGSILLYRLESLDPGEMMPELGRSLVHTESVALIRQWIEAMAEETPPGEFRGVPAG